MIDSMSRRASPDHTDPKATAGLTIRRQRLGLATGSGGTEGDHASGYVVLGHSGQTWTELPRLYKGEAGKQEAIDYARSLLDKHWVYWACVQGRGEPGHPTPPGEVVIYRGAAAGRVAVGDRSPFGPAVQEGDVERRG